MRPPTLRSVAVFASVDWDLVFTTLGGAQCHSLLVSADAFSNEVKASTFLDETSGTTERRRNAEVAIFRTELRILLRRRNFLASLLLHGGVAER